MLFIYFFFRTHICQHITTHLLTNKGACTLSLLFIDNNKNDRSQGPIKVEVTSELNNLTCWLRANRLSLNVAKTELVIIGSRQTACPM